MKNKQTTRVLLFWSFYTPASLMIWLLTEGQIIELVGIMIVLNYLAINLLFDKLEKNKKKVKDDPLLAFRILFSEKPLEAKK